MSQFDVEAARKAGYSDDDILQHLTSSRKFDVDAAVKSGYSKSDIISHLSGAGAQAPVDMSEKNYGTPDKSGSGFWAHAAQTVKDLPNAFLSGQMVSGPIKAVGQSMQDYVQDPTLHNSIRAIPGVGMAEDILKRPYQTAASGDLPGAFGDAVDISGQIIAPELARKFAANGLPDISPNIPKSVAVAKGTAKGAWNGATEMSPITIKGHTFKIPSVLASGAAGELVGSHIPFASGPMSANVGGTVGAIAPIVRGAVRGGKQALKDFNFHQEFVNRAPPEFSVGGDPSGTLGTGPQSGFGPSPKATPPPVEVGGTSITGIPDFTGISPEEMAARIHQEKYPTLGLQPELSSGPSGTIGKQDYSNSPIQPIQHANKPSVAPASTSAYAPPRVLTPDDLASVKLPDWLQKSLPEKASTPAVASEMSLLDDIARGQAGKQFSKLTPEQQATVRGIAARMGGGTAAVTPKPSFISPVEASLPGGKAVSAPVAAQPATSPVTSPVSITAPSQTVTPLAPTPTPGGTAMPHIETPAGLQDHYVSELKRINPIQSGNAVNKDLAIAQRLKGMGVTPESLDKMTDADLNPHYTSLGYKKLGSDNGGKQYGRTAEVGRQHLRMALENLWKP